MALPERRDEKSARGAATYHPAVARVGDPRRDRRSEAAGVEGVVHSGVSVYFRGPDGARLELIADPLGEMYGEHVL